MPRLPVSRHRLAALSSTILTLGLSGPAFAADATGTSTKPAVSDINARIEGAFGAAEEHGFGQIAGAVTIPLGERFGLQLDGLLRLQDDEADGGGAAHLFWRDPDAGLLGVYASHMRFNRTDADVSRIGVEAEAYLGDLSVIGVAGWQQTKRGAVTDENPFADLDFAFYPNDDLRLTAGYRYDGEDSFGVIGAEYKFSGNASAKVEGQIGESGRASVWAGLSIYFGGSDSGKSLKGRHREDDPTIWMTRQNAPKPLPKVAVAPPTPTPPTPTPPTPTPPTPPVVVETPPTPPVVVETPPTPPVVVETPPSATCISSSLGPVGMGGMAVLFCPSGVTPPPTWSCATIPSWATPSCFSVPPRPGDLMCQTSAAG